MPKCLRIGLSPTEAQPISVRLGNGFVLCSEPDQVKHNPIIWSSHRRVQMLGWLAGKLAANDIEKRFDNLVPFRSTNVRRLPESYSLILHEPKRNLRKSPTKAKLSISYLHRAIAEINHADRIQSRDNELHASRLSWLCCRSINTTIRGWLQHTGQIGKIRHHSNAAVHK